MNSFFDLNLDVRLRPTLNSFIVTIVIATRSMFRRLCCKSESMMRNDERTRRMPCGRSYWENGDLSGGRCVGAVSCGGGNFRFLSLSWKSIRIANVDGQL